MTFRLTVLGSSNAVPRPGRACSGYLIEGGGGALVADMGTGAFSNLQRVRAAETVDAIVISHMHADHFIDLIAMRYALKYGPRTNDRKVGLWLPRDSAAMLRRLVDAFHAESPHDFMGEVFEIGEYDAGTEIQVGEMIVRFAPTAHFIQTFALRSELDGTSVTYSADSSPSQSLAEFARETDLFLCEATLLPNDNEGEVRGHLTAAEAGDLAWRGAVRRLALTHYSAETNAAELRSEATQNYDGTLDAVDDNDVLLVE